MGSNNEQKHPLEGVRVLRELVQRPGQHGRTRLVAGQQEGLKFRAQLQLHRGAPHLPPLLRVLQGT